WPGVVVACRALGVVELEQDAKKGRERNDRLIAVPLRADRAQEKVHARDLPAAVREELGQFFISATFFEDKDARVLGWKGPKAAERLLARAIAAYTEGEGKGK